MSLPIVVIGSGPSGAVAAHTLIQRGIPVVMLESGDTLPSGILLRVNGRTILRRRPKVNPRGATHVTGRNPNTQWWVHLDPGGLTNLWTGAVPRFSPEDFTEGEQLDTRYRWPVDYEELVPFYERIEKMMSISGGHRETPMAPQGVFRYEQPLPRGWQAVDRAAQARGQALLSVPIANGAPWMFARQGTAFNSFTCLVVPLLQSPLFELRTGAHVLRLELDATQQRVGGVVYQDRASGQQHRISVAGAIIACGPLNSTKLLFDSACAAFPEGLGNREGVLGHYLHDHPHEWFSLELSKPISRLDHCIYLTRRPFGYPPLMASGITLGAASVLERVLSHTPLPGRKIGVQIMGSMVPTEDNFALPDREKKDDFGMPAIRVCIDFDKDVKDNMSLARKNLREVLEDAGYESRMIHEPNVLCPGSSVHFAGTVRMHNSPVYGMLDRYNRLHAVPNVLVTDASCFTTCPEKKPTLTMMALSCRAAERLADDLKRGTCV
nr:GMC family oxidoreductase [Armatimonas sp.]